MTEARALTRKTVVGKGHDCMAQPCGKDGCVEGKPRHGRAADEWEFIVTDGQIAFSVRVRSDELRGVYHREFRHRSPYRSLVEIITHTSFPRTEHEDSVRTGAAGEACGYLDGPCWFSHNGLKWAEEWFVKHGGLASRTDLPGMLKWNGSKTALPEQLESFWKALEVLHMEESPKLRADSIAHLAQCPGCKGRGVVDTTAKKG